MKKDFRDEEYFLKTIFTTGDNVWDIIYGDGKVLDVCFAGMRVYFDTGVIKQFIPDGRLERESKRTLFFKEFDIEIPKEALERPRWRAEKDDVFFTVDGIGQVLAQKDIYNGWCDEAFGLGNYFKTITEAEQSKFYKVFREED